MFIFYNKIYNTLLQELGVTLIRETLALCATSSWTCWMSSLMHVSSILSFHHFCFDDPICVVTIDIAFNVYVVFLVSPLINNQNED